MPMPKRTPRSVSSHREGRTFAVAAIGKDQVESYAKKEGDDGAGEIERWLGPVLGYEPGRS